VIKQKKSRIFSTFDYFNDDSDNAIELTREEKLHYNKLKQPGGDNAKKYRKNNRFSEKKGNIHPKRNSNRLIFSSQNLHRKKKKRNDNNNSQRK